MDAKTFLENLVGNQTPQEYSHEIIKNSFEESVGLAGNTITFILSEIEYEGLLEDIKVADLETDDKFLKVKIDNPITVGDVIVINSINYLCGSIENNAYVGSYKVCKILKCNTIIKFYDEYSVLHEYPCIYEKFGKGNDGLKVTSTLSYGDNQTAIFVPNNEHTLKFNKTQAQRFVIARRPWKVTDADSELYIGLIYVILEEDEIRPNDDIENKIAENIYDEIVPEDIPETGNEFILKDGNTNVYYGFSLDFEALLYRDGIADDPQPDTVIYSFDKSELVETSQVGNIISIIAKEPSDGVYATKSLRIRIDGGGVTTYKDLVVKSL